MKEVQNSTLRLLRDLSGRPVAISRPGLGFEQSQTVRWEVCLEMTFLQKTFDLTPRQARTIQLLFGRRTNQEIADEMEVTIHTARRHVEAALYKLGTRSRFEVETIVLMAQHKPAERRNYWRQ